MKIKVKIRDDKLVVRLEHLEFVYIVLQAKFIDQIMKDFEESLSEFQVLAYASGLIAVGILEVV